MTEPTFSKTRCRSCERALFECPTNEPAVLALVCFNSNCNDLSVHLQRSSFALSPTPATAGTPDVCPDCGLAHRVHAWNCPRVAFATVSIVPCSVGGAPLRDETPARETCPHCEGSVLAETGALTMEGYAIAVDCACGDGSLAGYASRLERQLAALRAASPSDETPEAAAALAKALHAAVAAIYFDDSADYRRALWNVVFSIDPGVADLLETAPHDAYARTLAAVSLDPEDTKHEPK